MPSVGIAYLDSKLKSTTFVIQGGGALSYNDFNRYVQDGWLCYLIINPGVGVGYETYFAVATNYHESHMKNMSDIALETYKDYMSEELSEDEVKVLIVIQVEFDNLSYVEERIRVDCDQDNLDESVYRLCYNDIAGLINDNMERNVLENLSAKEFEDMVSIIKKSFQQIEWAEHGEVGISLFQMNLTKD